MFLEILVLVIEAKLYKHKLADYFFICFNGRLGWIPFIHLDINTIPEKQMNYDDISMKALGCLNLSVDFEFSPQTLSGLSSYLRRLPKGEEGDQLIKIKFGSSLREV